jgi:Ni/Co efflux regulator RcnB
MASVSHPLRATTHGCEWAQKGASYVRIAIATGIIANIVLSQ